jgi:hypothetical protein
MVKESKALADYLARHGNKSGRDKNGRTWLEVYHQEVEGKYGHESLDASTTVVTKPTLNDAKGQAPTLPQNNQSKSFSTMDDFLNKLDKSGTPTSQASTKVMAPTAVAQPKPIPVATPKASYVAVGGDFVQKANAEKLMLQVQKNHPAQVIETVHPGGQKLYIVSG